jgi:hypothetical protein
MANNHNNSPENSLHRRQFKDRDFTLQFIRTQVENGTGEPLSQLIKEYSALRRYNLALWYVTTTNKAVCEAMYIPVEAGTKYKRRLEKIGCLVSSTNEFRCPYTGDLAHLVSTNPKEFEKLQKSNDTQLKIWEGEK